MSREDSIEVAGTVTESVSSTVYRVELENGHRLLAFVAGRSRAEFAGLVPGEKVTLQVSPFDLTKGRVIGRVKLENNL